MTSDAIDVATNVDDAYLPFVAVVAQSIAATSPRVPVNLHVLHNGVDVEAARAIGAFRPGNVRILLRTIDNPFARFGTFNGLAPASLIRLAMADLLPELDRAIYLDTDLMLLGDIRELAATDLMGLPAAGAPGIMAILAARSNVVTAFGERPDFSFRDHMQTVIGLQPSEWLSYVNAGVMVLNLAALRRERFAMQAAELMSRRNTEMPFRDQDAINMILKGRIAPVSLAWNANAQLFQPRSIRFALEEDLVHIRDAAAGPKCIHYAGGLKPWLRSRPLARVGLWWHFARSTPLYHRIVDLHRRSVPWHKRWRSRAAALLSEVEPGRGPYVRPLRVRGL